MLKIGLILCVVFPSSLLAPGLALGVGPSVEEFMQAGVRLPSATAAKILKEVIEEREVYTKATLTNAQYDFISAMKVHAPADQTKEILTRSFEIYTKEIPYVEKAEWDTVKNALHIVGGVWSYILSSWVTFEEKPPQEKLHSERQEGKSTEKESKSLNPFRVAFKVTEGHFVGLTGDMLFFPLESGAASGTFKGGTLAVIQGKHTAQNWPPTLIMEQGAALVMSFTAKRMRRYIETHERPNSTPSDFPKPRAKF